MYRRKRTRYEISMDARARKRRLESERLARAAAREKERARKLREKELLAKAKENKRLSERRSAYTARLELELKTIDLLPSRKAINGIIDKAFRTSVRKAQLKKYFITKDKDIEMLRNDCAVGYLQDNGLDQFNENIPEYAKLLKILINSKPQTAATKSTKYKKLAKIVMGKIRKIQDQILKEENAKKRREQDRKVLIRDLISKNLMFKADREEVINYLKKNDVTVKEVKNDLKYKKRIKDKQDYFNAIKNKIKPFKIKAI